MVRAPQAGSIQRRLALSHLLLGALASICLFLAIRFVAFQTAEATQDNLLRAAANTIAEQIGSSGDQVIVKLPHSAFAILETAAQDRIFYNVRVNGQSITGYEDFLPPDATRRVRDPYSFSLGYRGFDLRAVVLNSSAPAGSELQEVTILIGQTQDAQQAVADRFAAWAILISAGIFLGLAGLGAITAQQALRPLRDVTGAVERRGPNDLRPLRQPTPVELTPLTSALNDFIRRLRHSLRRSETFIAEAAHHIRTPLSTVKTETEIALRRTECDDTRRALRKVLFSVEESARSASQLLAYATVTQRSDSTPLERMDLKTKVQEAYDALFPTADLKDIEMHFTAQGPCFDIQGDVLMIEISLRNLIDNAIKYSDPDSRIDLNLQCDGDSVVLTIRDQGRGLGDVSPKQLFGRFKRGPETAGIVGTGMGLSIVNEVARSHGGQLYLSNNEERGTCAELSFPCLS
ncbi:sensor histidine kinase [Thalassobius sp. MITS945101]|uniref:sensor histidine kinase n=1 Tax=Thalassobius sp. MITS945101 TaxID=3096994 RepID=UPI00399C0EB9